MNYLRVTGLPVRSKNVKDLQALPSVLISASDDILLCERVMDFRLGTFCCKFRASKLSIRFPEANRFDKRCHRLKLSKRTNKLLDRSRQSNASPQLASSAAVFSMAGIARPESTNSRSPRQFVRCSARFSKSTVSLILL